MRTLAADVFGNLSDVGVSANVQVREGALAIATLRARKGTAATTVGPLRDRGACSTLSTPPLVPTSPVLVPISPVLVVHQLVVVVILVVLLLVRTPSIILLLLLLW